VNKRAEASADYSVLLLSQLEAARLNNEWCKDKLEKLHEQVESSLDEFALGTIRSIIAALDPKTNPLIKWADEEESK
jgi:hypothetical protein